MKQNEPVQDDQQIRPMFVAFFLIFFRVHIIDVLIQDQSEDRLSH